MTTCLNHVKWNLPFHFLSNHKTSHFIVDMYTCVDVPPPEEGCAPMQPLEGLSIRCSTQLDNNGLHVPGTICRGKCLHGYVPQGGRLKKKCRRDGTWSGTDGSCKQVYCPPLELTGHVQVITYTRKHFFSSCHLSN